MIMTSNKVVYGVFSQYEPTYKYDEKLESIWTNREDAEKEATRLKSTYDYTSIQEMYLNTECYWMNPEEIIK
jgi:hypothetical protein